MEYRRLKARKAEIDRLQRETKEKAAALAELQAEVERTQLHANINKVKADLSLQNAQSYLHDAEETKKRALEEEEEVTMSCPLFPPRCMRCCCLSPPRLSSRFVTRVQSSPLSP